MSEVKRTIVIDGKGHLMGRLAAIVAKQILLGTKVVVVRCESLEISGPIDRNRKKYHSFMKKRCLVNPKKGPFHHRSPSDIFKRAVRGMVPRKTERGKLAFKRLTAYEGVPMRYNSTKRFVCNEAVRILRLNQYCKYTKLADLSHQVGWKYKEVVERLEKKRIENNKLYYDRCVEDNKLKNKVIEETAELKPILEKLKEFGY